MGIKLGNGKWATKEDKLLAYRVIEGKYFDRSFDFARSSTTTRVNKDGYIEDVPSDTARIDFADSAEGALLTEPASTNLITYPITFGNSYWTKSGASIEGDVTPQLLVNGDMENGFTGGVANSWTENQSGTFSQETTIVHSGNSSQKIALNNEAFYFSNATSFNLGQKYEAYVWVYTDQLLAANVNLYIWDGATGHYGSKSITVGGWQKINAIFTSTGTGGHLSVSISGNAPSTANVYVDTCRLQILQGFEAPKEIPVANGEELVENGTFTTPVTEWTETGATTGGGICILDQDAVANPSVLQTLTDLNLGKHYLLTYDIVDNSLLGVNPKLVIYANTLVNTTIEINSDVGVDKKVYLFADGANKKLQLRVLNADAGSTITFTNVSVKEVTSWSGGGFEREAYKLVEDTSSGTHRISVSLSSSATEHTYAIFAKKGERDRIQLSWRTSGRVAAIFDLSNGSIISESGTLLTSASITTLVNGWYRCSVTFTLDDTGSRPLLLNILDENNNTSYQGDGTSGIYIAYAQLEEQSSATSLMLPTTEGSTTSRVADSCTGSGTAQDFKDYNASGTLYAEIAANGDDDVNKYITINDGTAANRIEIRITDAEDLRARVIVNSVASGLLSYAPSDITGFHKVAIRYAQSEFSLWVNGSERDTTTSGDVFPSGALTEVSFDRGDDIAHFYGKTKALEVLPYMSDEEMVTLTT